MKINKQQLNQKGKVEAILAAIVLVVIVVVGYWYVRVQNETTGSTSTSTVSSDEFSNIDTSDWKTYTSDELGVSFKYPEVFDIYSEGNAPEYDFLHYISFVRNDGLDPFENGIISIVTRELRVNEIFALYQPEQIIKYEEVPINNELVTIAEIAIDKGNTESSRIYYGKDYFWDIGESTLVVGGTIDQKSPQKDGFMELVDSFARSLIVSGRE